MLEATLVGLVNETYETIFSMNLYSGAIQRLHTQQLGEDHLHMVAARSSSS